MAAPMSTVRSRLLKNNSFIGKCAARHISCSSKLNSTQETSSIPLSQPLPGYENKKQTKNDLKKKKETRVTTLDNGMRVASEDRDGTFCTLGVLVGTGSRFEANHTLGISHFIEKLSFNSTTMFKDKNEINETMFNSCGVFDYMGVRDVGLYATSGLKNSVETLLEVLAEASLRPNFTDEEIEDARHLIRIEHETLNMNLNTDLILTELAHQAAFRNNTVGLPKICPEENINKIDRRALYTYLNCVHRPERMVIAGYGVDHDQLVDLANEHFVKRRQPIWEEDSSLVDKKKTLDNSIAQYTGGHVIKEADLSNISQGPYPLPDLLHLAIGYESVPSTHPDYVATCVLACLMGGGGSFSAGGPGKGMYTRLYTRVLNKYHFVNSATALNHPYDDTGLFVINASSSPQYQERLFEVIHKEMKSMAGQIDQTELDRAKTQLQSMYFMNLESSSVVLEDIGRHILTLGKRPPDTYYFDEIAKVSLNDIHRVASTMLSSKITLAVFGKASPQMKNEVIPSVTGRRSFLQRLRM